MQAKVTNSSLWLVPIIEGYDPSQMDFQSLQAFCNDSIRYFAIECSIASPDLLMVKTQDLKLGRALVITASKAIEDMTTAERIRTQSSLIFLRMIYEDLKTVTSVFESFSTDFEALTTMLPRNFAINVIRETVAELVAGRKRHWLESVNH